MNEDRLKPAYHFMSPTGDTHPFDPNGAIFWKGRYHLFYIFQDDPEGTHGYGYNCCWGHVSSSDLVHWKHHPVALRPGGGDDRCFSGSALVSREGIPTFIYNGGAGICIATSTDDDLIHWTKHPGNPVISRGSDVHGWREGNVYYALLGSSGVVEMMALQAGVPGAGDSADLYRSTNLVDWTLEGRFYEGNRQWTDSSEDCACPDFFTLGDKAILLFMSHYCGTQYYVGHTEQNRFIIERHNRMSWEGGSMIAPESMQDDRGRRIFWAWACETRKGVAQKQAGWSGVLTLPRRLSLNPAGELQIEPVVEMEQLRRTALILDGVKPDGETCVVRGDCLELFLDVAPGSAGRFGLKVFATSDGSEETLVYVDFEAGEIVIDASHSSQSVAIYHPWPNPWSAHHPLGRYANRDVRVQKAPFKLNSGEWLTLRVFLDRSIIEVFVNGRQCVTQRVYPTQAGATEVKVFSDGGQVVVQRFTAWELSSIYE